MSVIQGGGRRLVIIITEAFALILVIYLVALPFYPTIKYKLFPPKVTELVQPGILAASSTGKLPEAKAADKSPAKSTEQKQGNRIIISKIGVDAPIVESTDEKYGLNHGAWHMPNTGDPIKQGNMVITGHRFKYLPPNNLTFFLIDKIAVDDLIEIRWQGSNYDYKVIGSKIVPATETSILNPTETPLLTIFSCDPIYSTENRLVVTAEPAK
ncbi:MAG: sortase [Patescibacteria group bacterium]|nr:sortase [Patescibacteria group bacterium]